MVRRHWRANQRISVFLLTVWFATTFGVTYFARELSGSVLGWPFSFWMAAQGASLICLALVVLYAHLMSRVDDANDVADAADPDAPVGG